MIADGFDNIENSFIIQTIFLSTSVLFVP